MPGAIEVDSSFDTIDATIAFGSVPKHLPNAIQGGPNWEAAAGQLLLRVPGVATFLIRDGREVLLDAAPGRAPADLGIFIMGSVLGVLLHQRGCFVLHAGAVAVGGEAVLFCGPSGSGKSVLVAALSAAGYPIVCDEICCIDTSGSRPKVIPDGRRLKLWSDAIGRLSLEERRGPAVRAGFEKYWVDPPIPNPGGPLPLRAAYWLQWERLPKTAGIEPLSFLEFLATLRKNVYRRRLVNLMRHEQEFLDVSVVIARSVLGWHLTRKQQFDSLPACIRTLENHWGT